MVGKYYIIFSLREGAIIIRKTGPLFGGVGFRFYYSIKIRFQVSLNSPKLGLMF